MKLSVYSNVENGILKSNRKAVADMFKAFDGDIKITTEDVKPSRTVQQNAYLHLIFTIFKDGLNDLGNNFHMEEVKEMLKAKFLLTDMVNEGTGEVIGPRIKHTSELSKMEMAEFIDSIIRYAAETFFIILPYPGEKLKLELE